MRYYNFLVGVLFVWRITHLLSAEDGPWDVVVHLRRAVGDGFLGQMLDCFYCLSMWVAAPLALFQEKKVGARILLWPALSAGAILLERATTHKIEQISTPFVEKSEDKNGMLWTEKISVAD